MTKWGLFQRCKVQYLKIQAYMCLAEVLKGIVSNLYINLGRADMFPTLSPPVYGLPRIHHINWLKKNSHVIISVNEEKTLGKNLKRIHSKTLRNIGIEEKFTNLIKSVCKVLHVLATAIRQQKEIESIRVGKKKMVFVCR